MHARIQASFCVYGASIRSHYNLSLSLSHAFFNQQMNSHQYSNLSRAPLAMKLATSCLDPP